MFSSSSGKQVLPPLASCVRMAAGADPYVRSVLDPILSSSCFGAWFRQRAR
jgi:hypothetical protein